MLRRTEQSSNRSSSEFMADPTEEEIRTRAFQLWKDAGEPDGMMEKFWYQAEKELLQRQAARTAVRRILRAQ
jgi:Protein of unknown function (DUF2934)